MNNRLRQKALEIMRAAELERLQQLHPARRFGVVMFLDWSNAAFKRTLAATVEALKAQEAPHGRRHA
jgi:hypothetical protein